jgi:hypothetical protein
MHQEIKILNAQLQYMHQQLEVYSLMYKVFRCYKNFEMSTKYCHKRMALKREIEKKLDLLFELI